MLSRVKIYDVPGMDREVSKSRYVYIEDALMKACVREGLSQSKGDEDAFIYHTVLLDLARQAPPYFMHSPLCSLSRATTTILRLSNAAQHT
jgi:hypothetical protein